MFGFSSSYYDVWFIIGLLRRDVVCHLVTTLYLCGDDSNRQNGFDRRCQIKQIILFSYIKHIKQLKMEKLYELNFQYFYKTK